MIDLKNTFAVVRHGSSSQLEYTADCRAICSIFVERNAKHLKEGERFEIVDLLDFETAAANAGDKKGAAIAAFGNGASKSYLKSRYGEEGLEATKGMRSKQAKALTVRYSLEAILG